MPDRSSKAAIGNSEDLKERLLAMDKNDLFESMVNLVGGFGSHQVILWLVGLISSFLAAFNHFGIIFLAHTPEFQCVGRACLLKHLQIIFTFVTLIDHNFSKTQINDCIDPFFYFLMDVNCF